MEYTRLSLCFLLCTVCVTICEEVKPFKNDEEEAASLLDSIAMELLPAKFGYNGQLRSSLFNKNFSMLTELKGKRSNPSDVKVKGFVSLDSSLPSKVKSLSQKLDSVSLTNNLKYNVDMGIDGLSKSQLALKNEDGAIRRRKFDGRTRTPNATASPSNIPVSRVLSKSDVKNSSDHEKTVNLKKDVSNPNLLTNEVHSKSNTASSPSDTVHSKSVQINSSGNKAPLQFTPPGPTDASSSTFSQTNDGIKTNHFESSHHQKTTHDHSETPPTTMETSTPHSSNKSHSHDTDATTSNPSKHTSFVTTAKLPTTFKPPSGERTVSPPFNSTQHTGPPLHTTTHSPNISTQTPKPVLTSTSSKPTSTHSPRTTNRPHTTLHHSSTVVTTPKLDKSTAPPKNSTKKGSFGTTVVPSLLLVLVIPFLISHL